MAFWRTVAERLGVFHRRVARRMLHQVMALTDEDLDDIAHRTLAYRTLHVTLCPPEPLIADLLAVIAALREERARARRPRAA